ncbi:DNA replication/repair protein RecF [Nitrococcus mobilis]|uniref:DNA replication and repair protein RecF n=1 Tax=Nitrococcus mobilis Nb-231 TaxID=314278 RepID=A4BTW3_9GAMM|nr:DNA replication/repair protein RecF [Nitrococcus mobilis]EAR20784.1 recombination protein F [Nitrococcus mobilis Nb-231]
MTLARIEVEAFRNLRGVVLTPDPRVNFIWGNNASGKTSLLEAIHWLARGRSFLSVHSDQLIRQGCRAFTLGASIQVPPRTTWLGMERTPGRTRVRCNGQDIWNLSEIAWLLPTHVINTESQRLFVGAPQERRSLLDWGVFHVEHSYQGRWRRYQRALRQRNAALRTGDSQLARAWEADLVTAAEAVDSSRRCYLNALWPHWHAFIEEWLPELELHWDFQSGWPRRDDLRGVLAQARGRELERGHTLYGPHRGDLRFIAGDVGAAQRLSRGQQKLAAIALRLAQAELTLKNGQQRPVILVDDLAAELDAGHRERVLAKLLRMDAQLLLTALSQNELVLPGDGRFRVFHVEQGCYCEMV